MRDMDETVSQGIPINMRDIFNVLYNAHHF